MEAVWRRSFWFEQFDQLLKCERGVCLFNIPSTLNFCREGWRHVSLLTKKIYSSSVLFKLYFDNMIHISQNSICPYHFYLSVLSVIKVNKNYIWFYLHENFQRIILLVWVQSHPNIALYCRFQNQSQSGKERTSISGYERSSTADHIFWFRASTWFQNKEMFLKFSFSKLHPPTRTIFFEVQIHSLSSSTEIKITETSLLHNFLQLLKFASQYLTSGETS